MANTDLIIEAPRQGTAQSPFVGYGTIQNLDIYSVPGTVRLNKKLSASTLASGSFTLPNWIVRNPLNSSEFFALGNGGVVYTATDGTGAAWNILPGNTVTNASGNGLAIWKDYLFVARDASLDTFGPLTGVSCTVTAASPAVISSTGHGLVVSTPIVFSGTTLPSGISANTVYYVSDVNLLADSFQIKDAIGGSQINTTTTGSGVKYRTWYAPSSDGVSSFKSITSDADWHPMKVSRIDGHLYGGNANGIFKLSELTTFNPITSSTYSWDSAPITALPSDYRIKCIEEYGTNLYFGTWKGTNVYDFQVADLFPWDRTQDHFSPPIILNDFGVHALLTYGSSLLVWAGVSGVVYRTDGANFSEVARLPVDVPATSEWIIWSPGAVCKYKGRVFFGCGGGTNGSNTLSPMGTYSLSFNSKENVLVCEHINSQETTGSAEQVIVASLLPISDQRILAGFLSGSTKGIDLTSDGNYGYTTAYTAFFDSPVYTVGTPKAKRVFTELDIILAKTLLTGEGIKIQYRTNYKGTYADVGTYTHDIAGTSTIGGVISHFVNANLPKLETVQFRIALKGNGTTSTPTLLRTVFR